MAFTTSARCVLMGLQFTPRQTFKFLHSKLKPAALS